MRSIKTLLLAIALISALFTTLFIFSLNVIDPEIFSAIAVISALSGAISISSLILAHKLRREKEKIRDIKIMSAITVISTLLAAFLFSFLILIYTQLPGVPEKRPVFRIEDEAVKEDLIKRGLIQEYPNGTRVIHLKEVEELIKKGVYKISPDGTLEMNLTADLTAEQPIIPERRPVFKIEDETVKEDLIRRGLMEEYPNGTRYVNLGGIEELIKKGVYAYRINANGTIELVSPPSE